MSPDHFCGVIIGWAYNRAGNYVLNLVYFYAGGLVNRILR